MKLESLTDQGAQSLRTPGLYIEWHARGLAGGHGYATGVPVFIGFVGPGAFPADAPRARWFDRWERFAGVFNDGVHASTLLMHAVHGFFENSGERCLVAPVQADYESDKADARELAALLAAPLDEGGFLEDIEAIDLVCVPDAMSPAVSRSRDAVFAVQSSAAAHCARMGNRFAVLDAMSSAPRVDITREARLEATIGDVIAQWQTLPAEHGALYFPWIAVKPLPRARAGYAGEDAQPTVRVPPCGHIAGVYARSDRRVGVFKPPANEVLEGALDLDFDLADSEQAALNQAGINCLRERPGWGLRVWGARTLSERPELRYVSVTRLLLAIRRELEYGLRDLVFEPNNPALWTGVAGRLTSYFSDLFRRGALKGADASEAYFVKCDAETNPPEAREAGRVVAIAGIAPAAPAEFVIVRITQSADGVSVAGPDMQV